MKRLLVLCGLTLLVLLSRGRALGQDEQYLHIYGLVQAGDEFGSSGDATQALAKYLEAQTALQQFQKTFPEWNSGVVSFRLGYLASKISEATTRAPVAKASTAAPSKTSPPSGTRGQPAEASALEMRLNDLQSQLRQLQADKLLLEAKLKESLAAQPAAVDPRELANTQAQLRSLQKENDLLKVNLSQNPGRTAPAADPQALEQMKHELAEANRRLAEQTESAGALGREKSALQSKLDSLIPAGWNATNIAATRKALDDANRQLAEQTTLAAKLAQEKDALQSRLKTLTPDAEAAAALRTENDILKKQLAQLQTAPPGTPEEANHQLTEALLKVAILQSDKERLVRENSDLDLRVNQMSAPAAAASTKPAVAPAPAAAPDATRVKQLERERDDLQKKLAAAQKQLAGKNNKANASRVDQLAGEVEVLRARLGAYETQKVPYSAEELALLQPPKAPLADPRAGKVSVRELPAGAMVLVAEADRDFAARRYDQAEEKYMQVLKRDEKNLYTLANLAAIQLELNHLDDAEKHVNAALAVAPDDAYSLMILGEIQFRGQKFDEALDSLSRAAKADPRNAQIQNSLGLALSQKGMRPAAETAFRQAIELDPNYPSAHNNLAVFYLTQKPPATALARWHYDKARAAGMPPNPDLEKLLHANQTAQ